MKIYEFDPVIFPYKIWIVENPTYIEMIENFYFKNTSGDYFVPTENQYNANMAKCNLFTGPCDRINTGMHGVLCSGKSIYGNSVSTFAHEAVHIANRILYEIGMDNPSDNDEVLAYFVGWIVDCFTEVIKDRGE